MLHFSLWWLLLLKLTTKLLIGVVGNLSGIILYETFLNFLNQFCGHTVWLTWPVEAGLDESKQQYKHSAGKSTHHNKNNRANTL